MIALVLLLAWVVDRVEPPFAVLVDDAGRSLDVPLAHLPQGVGPGDRLAGPRGPRLEGPEPRRARLAGRLERLLDAPFDLESGGGVGQVAAVRRPRDHYAKKARREGYAARSVYKLEEIDRRVRLFRKGARVLDLGCAPGSWLQYAAAAVGPRGHVVGVDQRPVTRPMPPQVEVLQADVFELDPEALTARGGGFHVVMSDMAPSTTGSRFADHMASVSLCRRALALAVQVLRPGGAFVCKAFEGEEVPALVAEVRPLFERFRRVKPRGTRSESVELYLVGQGFRPPSPEAAPDAGPADRASPDASRRAAEMKKDDLQAVLSADERALLERLGPGLDVLARLRDAMLAGELTVEANRVRGDVRPPEPGDIVALPDDPDEWAELERIGAEAIRRGQVGLVLLNGGMATRFGGVVKGTVPVRDDRSFLGFKLLDGLRAARRAGAEPPVVILMNSVATSVATAEHLRRHDHFGYPPDRVWSFEQQWMVRLAPDGAPFLDVEVRPSFYGPGHGDLLPCLRRSGLLDRFRSAGGRVLLMSNVDNVVATLDPVLLGWHLRRGAAVTAEVADKHPGDVGGTPARVDGRPQIVEAFRFPPGFDHAAIPFLNTNTFWFDADALDREDELTWFVVEKKVDGRTAIQFERLIGELTAFAPSAFLHVPRAGAHSRFHPVKRPEDLEAGRDELVAAWEARG